MQISENRLMKISAFGTVVGLILLYFLSINLEAKSVAIGKIDDGFVGKFVNLTGTANGIKTSDTGMFFNLVDGDKKIKVVLWNNVLEQLELKGVDIKNLTDGYRVNLVGIVEKYKGVLDVVPTRAEVKIMQN